MVGTSGAELLCRPSALVKLTCSIQLAIAHFGRRVGTSMEVSTLFLCLIKGDLYFYGEMKGGLEKMSRLVSAAYTVWQFLLLKYPVK